MATNAMMERVVAQAYPHALRHLQQLMMDAERCERSFGKKGFFGGDKFKPALEEFQKTLARCFVALLLDGHVKNRESAAENIDAVSEAMRLLRLTYSSWPLAFLFWEKYAQSYRLDRGL